MESTDIIPEILNKICENIVVFDFIRSDLSKLILNSQIEKIRKNINTEKYIELTISDKAIKILENKLLENLDNGVLGIENIVESLLINPLSRYIFDNAITENTNTIINDIDVDTISVTFIIHKKVIYLNSNYIN